MDNVILEKVKNQAQNLKTLLDELQVQMALGKAEAREKIEEEKKTLSQYFSRQRKEMEKQSAMVNKERREFLSHVEALECSLLEEAPVDSEEYDDYKTDILEKIYKFEEDVRDHYPALSADLKGELDNFKAKMDVFRVSLALHDKDDPEKVEKIRNDFTEKLEVVRTKLGKKENSETRLDHFVDDISESFSYLKRAIEDLTN